MAKDVPFGCTCGAIKGTLRNLKPSSGGHVRCHCQDCRRAAIWIGEGDTAPDGIHYYQTTPDRIDFESGLNTLKAIKWKQGRLLRWYAPCCGVALFNTLDSPKWAFASLNTARFADPKAMGPAKAFAFKPTEDGKTQTRGFHHFMFGFMRRTIWARLGGSWRETPFFDENGAPIAPVQNLTREDRSKVAP